MVVARDSCPAIDEIRRIQLLEGAAPSPFDCWLVHRSLQALAYRMRGHAQNALKVARALEESRQNHRKVADTRVP